MKTLLLGVLSLGIFSGSVIAQDSEPKAKPNPALPFTISNETTRVTKHLRKDGTPDFAAAINAKISKGVTKDNNAAVLLLPLLGLPEVPANKQQEFLDLIGVSAENLSKTSLKPIADFAKGDTETLFDQQSESMSRPWTAKEFPEVAAWLEANKPALEIAHAAVKREKFFLPLVSNGEAPQLINVSLSTISQTRLLARLLSARAMNFLAEGDIQKAQADLLACHRLGHLVGQQPTLIESLVSIALGAIANQGDVQLAASGKLTREQLADYQKQLAKLPPPPSIDEKIDLGERFFFLDAVCDLALQRVKGAEIGFPNEKLAKRLMGMAIDWDSILKRGNKAYDRLVAINATTDLEKRDQEIEKWNADLKKQLEESQSPAQIALMFFGIDPPRQVVSRQMGNILISLLIPAVHQAKNAEYRAITQRNLTQLAFALAQHHKDHAGYPKTLKDLAPKYIAKIPKDTFTNEDPIYQPNESGFVLYSVGQNGTDDGGKEAPDGDDLVVKMSIK